MFILTGKAFIYIKEALNKPILDFPACSRQVRARKVKMRFSPSCLLQAGLQNQ